MLVMHVVQSLQVGGLERMVQLLTYETKKLGIRSHVLSYLSDGPLSGELQRAGVDVTTLRASSGGRVGLEIGRVARRVKPDVLHSHHLGPCLYATPASAALRIPHVHTEHSHEFYDVARRRWLGRLLSRRAHVVAVSEEVASYLSRELGVRSRVIVNGVRGAGEQGRSEARKRLALPAEAFVIGCSARLAPEKDHGTLLEAHARLPENSILVLLGDGPERARLEARADALGIRHRTQFLGFRDDVHAILPAFDALALTSQREGLPLAILEGMAAGLPFVATEVGELPELVKAGAGTTVAVGDVSGVAAALRALAGSPELRTRQGLAGKAAISERFSAAAMAKAYAEIYREVRPS